MSANVCLETLAAERVFDGGDLDCGSGLVLLIREHMQQVQVGNVLEMRSREPTVRDELPPWCRMVGHTYLGAIDEPGHVRYFIRRGQRNTLDEHDALQKDKEQAKSYQWRVRARSSANLASKVYCRNFDFDVGQPASFKDKDQHPSAVEYLLVALSGALSTGFASECKRDGLEVDDIEISARGRLHNVLAHLGLEPGDPSFAGIELKCFASTMADESRVQAAWKRTLERSPVYLTLSRATTISTRLAIV